MITIPIFKCCQCKNMEMNNKDYKTKSENYCRYYSKKKRDKTKNGIIKKKLNGLFTFSLFKYLYKSFSSFF